MNNLFTIFTIQNCLDHPVENMRLIVPNAIN